MKTGRCWALLALLAGVTVGAGVTRAAAPAAAPPAMVQAVAAVGLTVADLDRAVAFYTRVLGFEPVGEVETGGEEVERLQGLFGLRVRLARLRLGEETLELTEYLAPRGRPIPVDSRSHDRWFQHVAIIVSDMDRAYAWLRQHRVEHASPAPQRLPDWNPNAGGIRAFYFKDLDGHPLEVLQFPPARVSPAGRTPGTGSSSASTTPPSSSPTPRLDAMTHDRPHRKARPLDEALGALREGAGKQFDPRIAETALAIPVERWAELLGVPA